MTISERIFLLLQENGMSQTVLAELTGISPRTISDWKRKGTNPSAERIMVICRALQVTPEFLLEGNETLSPEKENRREGDPDWALEEQVIREFRMLPPDARKRLLEYLHTLIRLSKMELSASEESSSKQ